jgi:hypothetical protein
MALYVVLVGVVGSRGRQVWELWFGSGIEIDGIEVVYGNSFRGVRFKLSAGVDAMTHDLSAGFATEEGV